MRLLITGGTGFVGRNLLDQIALGSYRFRLNDVVITSRNYVDVGHPVEQLRWDVCDPNLPDVDFHAIIHAATPASAKLNARAPREMLDQIATGARNVVDHCARQCEPPRLLFTSSGAVYGEMPEHLSSWPEDSAFAASPLDPKSAYANGKRVAEAMFALAGHEGICRPTVARLFAFSGRHLPLGRHFAIGNFVRDAVAGGPIEVRGTGTAVRSYLDGSEMAHWLLAGLELDSSINRVIHIGSEAAITIFDLASLVAARASKVLGIQADVQVEGQAAEIDGWNRYVPSTLITRKLLGVNQSISISDSLDMMLHLHSTLSNLSK